MAWGWLLENRVVFGVCVLLATFIVAQAIAVMLLQWRRRRIVEKQAQLAGAAGGAAIPVTIVTGFLGAGKTQLLNRLLANPPLNERGLPLRIVVIENEAGAVSIDHALLKRGKEGNPAAGVYVLANGCMCCSAPGEGDELERTLDRLLSLNASHPDAFDYVIIETSGLADPAPIVETFFRMDEHGRFYIDGVIAVVDAKHISYHLDAAGMLSRSREAGRQVALADIILLNKMDLISAPAADAATAVVRAVNPSARLLRCSFADVPVSAVLHQNAFSSSAAIRTQLQSTSGSARGHTHDVRVRAVTITCRELSSGVSFTRVWAWLDELIARDHDRVYRVKALLRVIEDDVPSPRWFVIHGVHGMVRGTYADVDDGDVTQAHDTCTEEHCHHDHSATGSGEQSITAAIVIIGRDLDEGRLRETFQAHVLQEGEDIGDGAAHGASGGESRSRATRRKSGAPAR